MASRYTVERIDDGIEVRLARSHEVRCRVWVCDDVAQHFVGSLSETVERNLREQLRGEYDAVLARIIALLRAVIAGQPGGSIEVPDEAAAMLPFFN